MTKYRRDQEGDFAMPTSDDFFKIQAGRSLAKSAIVSKYFAAWANIVGSRTDCIAYVDLFCGPGRYEDGSPSTPLMVLENACKNERVSRQLVSIFNDADEDAAETLRANISALSCTHALSVDPEVSSCPVESGTLQAYADRLGVTPTLLFLDPWGYKDLSVEEIERFISSWGSECIFFFNYRRVNAAISNPWLEGPVTALFGDKDAANLRLHLQGEGVRTREKLVLDQLRRSLTRRHGKYVLWFRLAGADAATTYYLVHVTKAWPGYEVMRNVMDGQSSSRDAFGVSSFEYSPSGQSSMFRLAGSLPELQDSLAAEYEGQTGSVGELFKQHSAGRMYVMRNYRDAILALEDEGRVVLDFGAGRRRRGTLPERVRVTFRATKVGSDG